MNKFIDKHRELIELTKIFIQQEYTLPAIPTKTLSENAFFPKIQIEQPPLLPLAKKEAAATADFSASDLLQKAAKENEPLVKSVPIEKVKVKSSVLNKEFVLDPLGEVEGISLTEMKKAISQTFQEMIILEEIPCDSEAKKMQGMWKDQLVVPQVVLLSFEELPKQASLLINLAKAISICYMPAGVISAHKIEKEMGWAALFSDPALKLVIASDYAIYGLPDLMKNYKENSKTGEHFLKEKPLFLLPDLSLYLKEPLLKASLWRALCKTLS